MCREEEDVRIGYDDDDDDSSQLADRRNSAVIM